MRGEPEGVSVKRLGERPILQKIIVVNAGVILLGAIVGDLGDRTFADAPPWVLAAGFFVTGLRHHGCRQLPRAAHAPSARCSS